MSFKVFPDRAYFYEASGRESGRQYSDLYNFITARCDVPLLPDSVERRSAPPHFHNQNRDRYYAEYLSPIIGVFYSNRLKAVIVGYSWHGTEFWNDFAELTPDWDGLRIVTLAGNFTVSDPDLINEFEQLFIRGEKNLARSRWQ